MSSIINYPPLESYFNGAVFTGEASLNANVKIVDFGTVFNDNRYVIDNPFGNENYEGCSVKCEVFLYGIWSEVGGWNDHTNATTTGYGIKGFSNADGIVVQAGISGLLITSSATQGDGFGASAHGTVTTAPCRAIVTKIGGATDA